MNIPCSFYCSVYSSVCIDYNGNVWYFGDGDSFHNNDEESKIIYPPVKVPLLINIKMICSELHTVCLSSSNTVYTFGLNTFGQLGVDPNKIISTRIPIRIDLPPIQQINCGEEFTICLSDNGDIYSFGKNDEGQLGIGNKQNIFSPQQINNINNIDFITCGGAHTICKNVYNDYYIWGSNKFNQLGELNSSCSILSPLQITNWPKNIISIKCGDYHTLFLLDNGDVYSFGSSLFGELGNDNIICSIPTKISGLPPIKRIECGECHSMCIDFDNNLWAFGWNMYGQLGLPIKLDVRTPTKHPTLTNILDISSGGNHTFIKTIDNKIYAFGNNEYSQIIGKDIRNSDTIELTQVFKDNEEIWNSSFGTSRQKSAYK